MTDAVKLYLRLAKERAELSRFGNYEVFYGFDKNGGLMIVFRRGCAEEKVPPGCECPYCGEDHVDNILAPDDDSFCFCLRCNRYYYVGD